MLSTHVDIAEAGEAVRLFNYRFGEMEKVAWCLSRKQSRAPDEAGAARPSRTGLEGQKLDGPSGCRDRGEDDRRESCC